MQYVLTRILILVPTFVLITMIAFGLQKMAPGDPIEKKVKGDYLSDSYDVSQDQYRSDYQEIARQLGRDKPTFYLTLTAIAYDRKFHETVFPSDRVRLQEALLAETPKWKFLVPRVLWNGFNNQYHDWLCNVLRFDFGKSYDDSEAVSSHIARALRWTMTINGLAILIALGLSIIIGVWLATTERSWARNLGSVGLYTLYSIPSFWTATMLVVFFTTAEYGLWTDLFPTQGVGSLPAEAPFWNRFWDTAGHLILPVFCLTYGVLAYITMQMRKAMQSEMSKQYIMAARARGFSERHIIWREAFPNALFPMITLVAMLIPSLFTGSVVIEAIFGIPGMGWLTLDAIQNDDWPIVYGVLVVIAIITMIGNLLGDVLYAWANPKVEF